MQENNRYMVVGLGNPGPRYIGTRHNVGFDFISEFCKKHDIGLTVSKFNAIIGQGNIGDKKVIALMPQTYMNLSGDAVKPVADYYKILPENVIVVYDDIYLQAGKIRIRENGSAGGHNGMKSIIAKLRTEKFPRIRIGVSEKPANIDLADYVLSKFTKEECQFIDEAISNSVKALEVMLSDGNLKAMNMFNGR